ncbi:MAG TPA: hypothetical protein VHJ20_14810 [Polyangia bacterium]|nr:hypothetical protein [Polyangia bacterium]
MSLKRSLPICLAALLAGCGGTKTNAPADGAANDGATDGDAESDAPDAGATPDAGADTHDASTDGLADASDASDASDAHVDGSDASDAAAFTLPATCAADKNVPPNTLVCTGLYADIATKAIAPGVVGYAPAVPLWADGASKQRWIYLPPGMKIDNTDPNEWIFPVGTKVWKEFSRDGQRVETRLWQKVTATYWVAATYAWSDDESEADRSAGGDIPWGDGGTYHIPTSDECQQCHRGRTDRILGFEQTLLGLAGATGVTLGTLGAEGRLTVAPPASPLVIGDDGTGLAAPALAWLHVNCGTTCHNQNSSSAAWATGLFMRLDPTQLDGRSSKSFDTLTTTVGVAAVSPAWRGKTRIVPHDPSHSLLYQLISHRGTGNQMPPIATSVVDEADVPLVEAWIDELAPLPVDGGTDGSTDEADDRDETDGGHGSTKDASHDVGAAEAGGPLDGGGDAGPDAIDAPVDTPVDAPQPDATVDTADGP